MEHFYDAYKITVHIFEALMQSRCTFFTAGALQSPKQRFGIGFLPRNIAKQSPALPCLILPKRVRLLLLAAPSAVDGLTQEHVAVDLGSAELCEVLCRS